MRLLKKTADLLRSSGLNFLEMLKKWTFLGTTDVIVCDGFVGNVALKSSEGLAQIVGYF